MLFHLWKITTLLQVVNDLDNEFLFLVHVVFLKNDSAIFLTMLFSALSKKKFSFTKEDCMKSLARFFIIFFLFSCFSAQGMFNRFFGRKQEEPQKQICPEVIIESNQLHNADLINFRENPRVGTSYFFLCDLVSYNRNMMADAVSSAIPLGALAKLIGLVGIMVTGITDNREDVCTILDEVVGNHQQAEGPSILTMLANEVEDEQSLSPKILGDFFARFCTTNVLDCLSDHKSNFISSIKKLCKQRLLQGCISIGASRLIDHCTTEKNRSLWKDNFGAMGRTLSTILAKRSEELISQEEETEGEQE